jgi:hypothetical protein
MSRKFPTALAHRAEGQSLFEGCGEVPNMKGRNAKVNHFQEERARFETTIGLYGEEGI